MKWILLALVAICAIESFAYGKSCKKAEDCEEGQCCVNYALVTIFGGHCKRLKEKGETCTPLVKDNGEKPDMYHYQCPCKEGLECVGKRETKILDHIIKIRPECVIPGSRNSTHGLPDNSS